MDRFLEMRVFAAVVDAGSFVQAAETLDMSKAAVSRIVADLEARLAVRLMHAPGSCLLPWTRPKPKSPRAVAGPLAHSKSAPP
jgi:Bacterial regulatory helix-turn-helix protein, lysR family